MPQSHVTYCYAGLVYFYHQGDFYVTRHSNLAECHVVFHLVGDAQVKNTSHLCGESTIFVVGTICCVPGERAVCWPIRAVARYGAMSPYFPVVFDRMCYVSARVHMLACLQAASRDMSTRSEVMIGLRNVFRCAFKSEVNHVTLPLLMVHQLTEVSMSA